MENASKALIMAGGVLLSLMIVSIAIYLFTTFGATSSQTHKQIEADRINEFNSQFNSYVGKEDITIYDVVTVTNLAKNTNTSYDLDVTSRGDDTTFYVNVKLSKGSSTTDLEQKTPEELVQLIKTDVETVNNENNLPKYDCKVLISSKTQRVYQVTFTLKGG